MITSEFKLPAVNVEALNDALKTALPGICDGFTYIDGVVTVYMLESATKQQLATAERIIKEHDPSVMSDAQLKEIANKQAVAASNAKYAEKPIDISKYTLEELVERVSLLERKLKLYFG